MLSLGFASFTGVIAKMLSGIVKGYINNIVAENEGLKVMLFDSETVSIPQVIINC